MRAVNFFYRMIVHSNTFFCLVELPSNECNPGINDIMSIYYLRVCSLSLFLSLSLVRSLSLSSSVKCVVRRKKFRNSDMRFFLQSDIFRVSCTVRVEVQQSLTSLLRVVGTTLRDFR